MLRLILILIAGLLASGARLALADEVAAVNQARLSACPPAPGPAVSGRDGPSRPARLRRNARLDAAARLLAAGQELQDATKRAGYRSITSASVQMSNVPGDRDVTGMLARRFCAQVSQPALQDVGTYRRGMDVWLIVAAPFSAPSPREQAAISDRVLLLTNQVRSHAQRCGKEWFPAAPPLTAGPASLTRAALDHSQDMARHNYMDHTGLDGSTPAQRVTRSGYQWVGIGENLASGVMTADDVVKGWLGSPHHCENLMTARFTQMSVAYAVNTSSSGGIYWTQLFGTPPAGAGAQR